MTTVVYDHKNKQIAYDSRCTAGGVIQTDSFDKHVSNDIGEWFLSCDVCDMEQIAKLKHNESTGDTIPDGVAMLVKDSKVYLVYVNSEAICCYSSVSYSIAIGSGQQFAMAAIDHGKSAKEAVEYAKTRCAYTGGEVKVYNI